MNQTIKDYESVRAFTPGSTRVQILIDGRVPDGARVPREALPNCRECAKPELRADNYDAVRLFAEVQEQQTYAGMGGTRMGIRYEALLSAARDLEERGEIEDASDAMRGARQVDAAVNERLNAESSMAPRPGPDAS